jgi:hypothetical protein
MPQKSIAEISQRPVSQTERVVRKWIVVFGSLFLREITPLLVSSWCELLGDLPAALVEAACAQVAKTCRFFPAPGEIRAQIDQAESKAFELEAERGWEQLLNWIRENVFPDSGIRRGAPRLAPAVWHAAKAAGGVIDLESCKADQLPWRRKTFLSSYKNIRETAQVEHLLSDGDARKLLRDLSAGAPAASQKLLAVSSGHRGDKPTRAEVREFLDRVTAEQPRAVASESREDLERIWKAQKERLASRAAELGIAVPADLACDRSATR